MIKSIKRYNIDPVAKPRMTRRDKFKVRKIVAAYRKFKDDCKFLKVKVPYSGAHVTFWMPMPRSWHRKKKISMQGAAHQSVPDLDNLLKGLLDAVYIDDKSVWNI